MILKSTRVVISDNSGGKIAETIKVTGKYANIGDVIVVSIKDAIPGKTAKKGEVHYGVVIRTKKGIIRPDGTKVAFSDNAITLIKENGQPIATRIFGQITQELRKNHPKLLALTNEKIG
jgi:large subunit ribosomal protein L14